MKKMAHKNCCTKLMKVRTEQVQAMDLVPYLEYFLSLDTRAYFIKNQSSSGFLQVTGHKTLGIPEGFGVRGFFPFCYLPAANGGQEKKSLKYCMKKKNTSLKFHFFGGLLFKIQQKNVRALMYICNGKVGQLPLARLKFVVPV